MNIKSIFAMAFMATALVGTAFSFVACEDDEKQEVVLGGEEDGTFTANLDIAAGVGPKAIKLATVKGQKVVVLTLKSYQPLLTISGYETPTLWRRRSNDEAPHGNGQPNCCECSFH